MKKYIDTFPQEGKDDFRMITGLFVIAAFIVVMSLYVVPPLAQALETAGIINRTATGNNYPR